MPPQADLAPYHVYARDVVAGRIHASRWVVLAAERHLRDLRDGAERGLRFDPAAAQHALDFFGLLRHSKGQWAGKPFVLQPWQAFIVASLFGWQIQVDGEWVRRFRKAYVQIGRKNGKSTFAAGIVLYLFYGDGEPGADVYCAATKNAQAKIVWGEAMRMVKASPRLARAIGITGGERPGQMANMHVIETASKLEPLGADRDTTDGLNPHGAVVDELHAHKTRGMWDILETAIGARRQPLLLAITTAGYDRHSICWEVRDYSAKVLEGVLADDSWFAFVAEVAEDADWTDEAVWPHGNPNLGISVKLDDLRALAAKAEATPAAQNAFRRLRLDQWTDQASRWMPIGTWDACRGEVDPAALRGRVCYAGLDLSSTRDLTALVLYFPPVPAGDPLGRLLAYFWVPEENVEKRERDDRVPYRAWIAAKLITPTPGNVVDYDRIREFVKGLAVRYSIAEIAYDPWRATQLAVQLQEDGATCVEFRQGMASMAGPMAEAEKLILGKKIVHDGHPVLRWNLSNVAVKSDEAENVKPDKARSRERIDGLVAWVMAVGRAMVHAPPRRSRYEEEGATVLVL
jgi:phage terminase large subunit-like protein